MQAVPDNDVVVETDRLTKHYGSVRALVDCTLRVQRGEIFGLLGPNGSGKTTLLRLIMGFLRPTHGWARVLGLDCYRRSVAVHEQVSYLPGDVRLFRQMRGRDVLRFFAEVRSNQNYRRSLELAEQLELDLARRVVFCSTGMRQKLALAAVLAADVPVLILDEPTANLDPTIRGRVLDFVREARQHGRTVLFSSHVLSEIEATCDRVVLLRRGKLVHTQVIAELRRQHRIFARLNGPLPAPPPQMADRLRIRHNGQGHVMIETADELSPLLGWLAQLPLSEIKIEPIGLQAVYERYHEIAPEESRPLAQSHS